VVTLPELNPPSTMPSSAAQRIYLAFILEDYASGSPGPFSQRGGRKLFNRGGGRLVSKDLIALCDGGWLISRQFEETEALTYRPGRLLTGNPKLHGEWQSFASSLFGTGGLVKRFVNSAVWGHGVFGFNQTLVLGTLVYRNQSFRRVDIIKYLDGLVGISSIDTALRTLVDAQIVSKEKGTYIRSKEWSKNLKILLDSHMGGTARKKRIAREVRKDRYGYATLIRLGHLTHTERRQLLKNPCLRCGNKAKEVEHYPPRKYGGYDHTHLVWAICKKCNEKTQRFIQKLGPLPPFRSCVLVVKKGLDANVLLRSSLLLHLRRFYKAAERKDYTAGLHAVHKSLQFIDDLETLGLLQEHPTRRLVHKRGARSVKGRNSVVRESSRKKYL
jgi:hypothetical protein